MPQRDLLPLEMIGLLSGDPMISRAVTAGRGPKGGRKSIGQGLFYNPETDEVEVSPEYTAEEKKRYDLGRDREKEEYALDAKRKEELHQRRLRDPDYHPMETEEGVTVYDINPRNAPDVAAEAEGPYRIPMDQPRAPAAAAQKAAEYERAALDTERLVQDLPEGVGGFWKPLGLAAGEMAAPERMEPIVRSKLLDWMYDPKEQKAIRQLSQNFATILRQFAGAAQTPSEKANVQKFMPTPDMSHEQLVDSMADFVKYAEGKSDDFRYPRGAPQRPARQAPAPETGDLNDAEMQELEELRRQVGGR